MRNLDPVSKLIKAPFSVLNKIENQFNITTTTNLIKSFEKII